MNNEWMLYLLRLSTIWMVLLLFYRLALRRNGNWKLHGRFLIGIYLAGIILPALPSIPLFESVHVLSAPTVSFGGTIPTVAVDTYPEPSALPLGTSLLLAIYALGALTALVPLLCNIWKLYQWKKLGNAEYFGSIPVVCHPDIPIPMAGFRTLFLPAGMDPAAKHLALLHEAAHVRHYHTWQRLLFLIGRLFLWFHPLHWFLLRKLEQVQEYQADASVCRHVDGKAYSRFLLRQVIVGPVATAWPALFSSPLKSRITMMQSNFPARSLSSIQALALCVLFGALLVSCTQFSPDMPSVELPVLSVEEVDQAPQFENSPIDEAEGKRALLTHIYRNIKYPAVARQAAREALIRTAFVIDQNGHLFIQSEQIQEYQGEANPEMVVVMGYGDDRNKSNSASLESADAALESEVERVLKTLHDWRPAMHQGKPVAVQLTLDFLFKLQE